MLAATVRPRWRGQKRLTAASRPGPCQGGLGEDPGVLLDTAPACSLGLSSPTSPRLESLEGPWEKVVIHLLPQSPQEKHQPQDHWPKESSDLRANKRNGATGCLVTAICAC